VRGAPDPLTGLSSYDSSLLFHLAAEAQRAGEPERAVSLYGRFLTEFPDSRLGPRARYNLGLALEGLQRFGEAAAQYETLARLKPPAGEEWRTWLDAHYRWAVCLGELGDPWGVVAVFDRLLEVRPLDDFDHLEALVGRGMALRRAGNDESAESALSEALRFSDEASGRGLRDDGGMTAEAAFAAGEIAAARFEAVQLELPVSRLRPRLEQKCELLLLAQHRYVRAMRRGGVEMLAAAGFRVGALYESLYRALVGLEIPQELSQEQAEVYRDEVDKRVSLLVNKAMTIYERSLLAGRIAPGAAPWVQRLESALSRLKALYLEGGHSPAARATNPTSRDGA
jgi:tetratricopeptide (TPR) repeat protein